MVHVLHRIVSGWPPLRATLALSAQAFLIYCVLCVVCLWPGNAFALSGYSRILTPANFQAMVNARAVAQRSLLSTAVLNGGSSGVSIGLRMVPGIGWAALGVSAALTLAQIYYSQSQSAAIYAASAVPWSIPGVSPSAIPANTAIQFAPCTGSTGCTNGQLDAKVTTHGTAAPGTSGCVGPVFTLPAGWGPWGSNDVFDGGCKSYHSTNTPSTAPLPPGPPTGQTINSTLATLPANDPNSMASNTDPLGVGQPAPDPANTTISDPITTTDAQTTVVPTSAVPPGSVVVNPDATPPAGSQTTTPVTQQDTTTTTTTTNPNGSTTTQTTTATTASCAAGAHDERSFGAILQAHIDMWKGSGILGQVALLQSLTWPSALPTITLTSGTWGTHSINFNDWSAMFTALRSIVIAGAGFAAYRIIFVGGGS